MNIYLFFITTLLLLLFSKIRDSDEYIILGLPFLYIFSLYSLDGSFGKSTVVEVVIVLIPIFFRKMAKKRDVSKGWRIYGFISALLLLFIFIGYRAAGESLMMVGGLGKVVQNSEDSTGLIIIGLLCVLATLQLERKKKGDEIKWN